MPQFDVNMRKCSGGSFELDTNCCCAVAKFEIHSHSSCLAYKRMNVVVKLKLKNPERSCCLLHIHPEPNKIQFLCTNVANMHQKVLCMPRPELDRLFAALGPPVKAANSDKPALEDATTS